MKEFEKLNRIGEGTYGIVCEWPRREAGPGTVPRRPSGPREPGWKPVQVITPESPSGCSRVTTRGPVAVVSAELAKSSQRPDLVRIPLLSIFQAAQCPAGPSLCKTRLPCRYSA